MRKILVIAWKDTLLRFSGWSEWLFFIILPIIFTVILAGGTGAPVDTRTPLGIVDQANTPLSQNLVATLDKSGAVRLVIMKADEAEKALSNPSISAVLFIPSALSQQQLEQGVVALDLRQLPNNINAQAASRAVLAAIRRVSSAVDIANQSVTEAEKIKPFESAEARSAYQQAALQSAAEQMDSSPQRMAVMRGATRDAIPYDPRANSSAGQLISWVFVPLIGISAMFAYERQQGTLRRLLVSPTHKATYLIGTIFGQGVMAIVQMLLLIGFGMLVLNLKWGSSPQALAIMLVCSTLAAAAMGTMLGTFVKTEGQAGGLSMMLGMVMALLGGCWYPIELFPPIVQQAVKILPTRWAMQGMLDIVARHQDWVAVLPEAGVLLGFALVFFTIGVLRFRYE
jgi:ABC-2 type transport system permease protein